MSLIKEELSVSDRLYQGRASLLTTNTCDSKVFVLVKTEEVIMV